MTQTKKDNEQKISPLDLEQNQKHFFQGKTFLISLVLHLLVFIILVFILARLPRTGTPFGERNADSVGIVFSDSAGQEGQSGGSTDHQNSSKATSSQNSDQENKYELPDTSVSESFLPKREILGVKSSSEKSAGLMSNLPSGIAGSGSDIVRGSGTNGSGLGSGSGDGQTVSFSDIKGNGRKFVFVLDRSESMSWSNAYPMKFALAEAKASISSLSLKKGALKFQIIFYNHEAMAYGNGRLLPVNEPNKNLVLKYLDTIFPQGGTDPVAAMELAVQLSPDVIFFLTDADEEIPPLSLSRIHELARSHKIRQIHVVEFGKSTAKEKTSFRQLARDNNGQYIFKKID